MPVTQAEYGSVTGQWPSASRSDRRPVEGVSWADAIGYCNARSRAEGLTPAYRVKPGSVALERPVGRGLDPSA